MPLATLRYGNRSFNLIEYYWVLPGLTEFYSFFLSFLGT